MEERDRLRLEFEIGGSSIRVKILDQESADFTTDELSGVICLLAEARTALEPPVEISDPIAGQKLQISVAERWFVDQRPNGNRALMLLHPGFGWIAIELSPTDAARAADALMVNSRPVRAPRAN